MGYSVYFSFVSLMLRSVLFVWFVVENGLGGVGKEMSVGR